jgi:ABC-type nitrate/sulfonate/bicarbonate transport system substrate-binding protein
MREEKVMLTSRLVIATAAAIALLVLPGTAPQASAETIILGQIGSGSTIQWPVDIAVVKGFLKKRGVELDIVTTPSNPAIEQQLAAGSLNLGSSIGVTDPIRAKAQGSPVVILRVDAQASPYVIVTAANINSLKDLKGKVISLDTAKGITRAYWDKVIAPAGLKHDEFDYIYQGATPARLAAVKSGAAAASMLTSPFDLYAEAQGLKRLIVVPDVVKDIPFTVTIGNSNWVNSHKELTRKYLDAINEGAQWFYDPKNRAEAIAIKLKRSKMKEDDLQKSYDFFHKLHMFNTGSTISKQQIRNVMDVLVGFGDLPKPLPVEQLVVPDITKVLD